jgi:hypothetical protein
VGVFKKLWNDSVLSNAVYDILKYILKWVLTPVVSVLVSYFAGWWPTIGEWIFSESKIPNWLLSVLCIVSICGILKVCFAVIFRYKREKMDVNGVELDRLVYKRIINILPWDGSITFIREHDFYGSFDRDSLRDLYN